MSNAYLYNPELVDTGLQNDYREHSLGISGEQQKLFRRADDDGLTPFEFIEYMKIESTPQSAENYTRLLQSILESNGQREVVLLEKSQYNEWFEIAGNNQREAAKSVPKTTPLSQRILANLRTIREMVTVPKHADARPA